MQNISYTDTPNDIQDTIVNQDSKPLLEDDIGAWVLYYPEQIINERWKQIIEYFKSDQFEGVYGCQKISPLDTIYFFCNSLNKGEIQSIGFNIIRVLKDILDNNKYIYYKTNDMLIKNGKGIKYKIKTKSISAIVSSASSIGNSIHDYVTFDSFNKFNLLDIE